MLSIFREMWQCDLIVKTEEKYFAYIILVYRKFWEIDNNKTSNIIFISYDKI